MGKKKIIIRQTSMLRKSIGQMKKLMGTWGEEKKLHVKANPMPSISSGKPDFLNTTNNLNNRFVTRRQIVMNRHFTEIISDILANNLKKHLSDIGVNITSIETKAWNKGVRVFYSTYKPFDSAIHKDLNSLVTQLKAAITERRLIGRTPQINFVFDENDESNRTLNEALSAIKLEDSPEVTSLIEAPSDGLKSYRRREYAKSSPLSRNFTAPDDMTNIHLGIDYPSLYNQVVSDMARGRAESSRMKITTTLMPTTVLFNAPVEDEETEDARTRIMNMKTFVVRQRSKNEYLAKLRRKKELLYRDQIKWEMPREDDGEEENVSFDSQTK